jgi:hypothetical protein
MSISALLVWTIATLVVVLLAAMFGVRWLPQKSILTALAGGPPSSPPNEEAKEPTADLDPFSELQVETTTGSRVTIVKPTVGEPLASADITLFLSNRKPLIVERAWVALPGSGATTFHLELDGTPLRLDAEGRCLNEKPGMKANARCEVALSHSWVSKGPSIAESDEQVPLIVTLELADDTELERKSLRLLFQLSSPSEAHLYLDDFGKRTLVQRVFERNVESMHLLKV